MIHLLKGPATSAQILEMLQQYEGMIKIVVDIRRRFLSGGGEMHADCEAFYWPMAVKRMICGGQIGIRVSRESNLNH